MITPCDSFDFKYTYSLGRSSVLVLLERHAAAIRSDSPDVGACDELDALSALSSIAFRAPPVDFSIFGRKNLRGCTA